jgi:tRNA A-37 threonylcarbamoyl transferase component Bud32
VRISKEFVELAGKRKTRFTNLLKTGQRALFASLLSIFPQVFNAISQNKEFLADFQKFLDRNSGVGQQTENPHNYIYIPTANGLVPLANRIDIEAFARKVLGTTKDAEVQIESMGGILNDVYLVSASQEDVMKRVVVKSFRDWSSFKWFPLTLWAVGTRSFAVLGGARLQREYAMNQLLHSSGISVPRILHISPRERLVFMEHIEGEDLSKLIKRTLDPKNSDGLEQDLDAVRRVGCLLARIHANDIALGDAKPENFMINSQGEIYLMDLEQAGRKGDQSWDVGEFLYYAGHYSFLFTDSKRMERIAKTFLAGYLEGGGNPRVVRNAGNPKYTKVFSVFTLPSIILAISNICRKTDKSGSNYGKTRHDSDNLRRHQRDWWKQNSHRTQGH